MKIRRARSLISACGLTLILSSALVSFSTANASADSWVPYCGPSEYVDHITVKEFFDTSDHYEDFSDEGAVNGHEFTVDLYPTPAARFAISPGAAVDAEWQALQNCVTGLYGTLADSIYDQLECHQQLALVPGEGRRYETGDSYGLDSWAGTFDSDQWLSSGCGNDLTPGPENPDAYSTYRPDDGVTDLDYGDIG